MKTLSFKSCHIWKLYQEVLQEEHKAKEKRLIPERQEEGIFQ